MFVFIDQRVGVFEELAALGNIHLNGSSLQEPVHLGVVVIEHIERAHLLVVRVRQRRQRVMRLASQRAPTRHRHRKITPGAGREEDCGRLCIGGGINANRRQHLRNRGTNLGVPGQSVFGERELDLETVRVTRIGHQFFGCRRIELGLGQRLVEAKDRRCHHLAGRLAQAFHGEFDQAFAVNRQINRLAYAQVKQRIFRQRRTVLVAGVLQLVAHVEFDIENIDCVDGLHIEFRVALECVHVGGGHAGNQVKLTGLELGHTGRVVGNFFAHVTSPGLLRAPVTVKAVKHKIALGLPRHEFVGAGANRCLARIEGLVGVVLGQASGSLRRDDEQADEVVWQGR